MTSGRGFEGLRLAMVDLWIALQGLMEVGDGVAVGGGGGGHRSSQRR